MPGARSLQQVARNRGPCAQPRNLLFLSHRSDDDEPLIAQSLDADELARWMIGEYGQAWDRQQGREAFSYDEYVELVQSCIDDTVELVSYEQAHDLPVFP